ncbi:MAG TPA: hypothetical protein VKG45_00080 [Actinomycetes bacterium]|nr:hypothetical protein [Actinomycetes bacterium]
MEVVRAGANGQAPTAPRNATAGVDAVARLLLTALLLGAALLLLAVLGQGRAAARERTPLPPQWAGEAAYTVQSGAGLDGAAGLPRTAGQDPTASAGAATVPSWGAVRLAEPVEVAKVVRPPVQPLDAEERQTAKEAAVHARTLAETTARLAGPAAGVEARPLADSVVKHVSSALGWGVVKSSDPRGELMAAFCNLGVLGMVAGRKAGDLDRESLELLEAAEKASDLADATRRKASELIAGEQISGTLIAGEQISGIAAMIAANADALLETTTGTAGARVGVRPKGGGGPAAVELPRLIGSATTQAAFVHTQKDKAGASVDEVPDDARIALFDSIDGLELLSGTTERIAVLLGDRGRDLGAAAKNAIGLVRWNYLDACSYGPAAPPRRADSGPGEPDPRELDLGSATAAVDGGGASAQRPAVSTATFDQDGPTGGDRPGTGPEATPLEAAVRGAPEPGPASPVVEQTSPVLGHAGSDQAPGVTPDGVQLADDGATGDGTGTLTLTGDLDAGGGGDGSGGGLLSGSAPA